MKKIWWAWLTPIVPHRNKIRDRILHIKIKRDALSIKHCQLFLRAMRQTFHDRAITIQTIIVVLRKSKLHFSPMINRLLKTAFYKLPLITRGED